MSLQIFSSYYRVPAKVSEYHFRAVCQGFRMLLLPPSTNFLLIGLSSPTPKHIYWACTLLGTKEANVNKEWPLPPSSSQFSTEDKEVIK